MSTDEIHAHGRIHALRNGNPPKAYGAIRAAVIERHQLTIERDDTPPLHANVIGWPTEKSAQMSIAQELAAEAELYLAL